MLLNIPENTWVSIQKSLFVFQSRQIPAEKGRQLAQKWDSSFFECSATSGEGVNEVFLDILSKIEDQRGCVYRPGREKDRCLLM